MNMTLLTEGVLVAIMKEFSLLKSVSVICFFSKGHSGTRGESMGQHSLQSSVTCSHQDKLTTLRKEEEEGRHALSPPKEGSGLCQHLDSELLVPRL